MGKVRCKKCGFHYETDKIPKLCPNCGEEKSIEKEKTAREILDEI